MDRHIIEVNALRDDLKREIQFTQGSNLVPVEAVFLDWGIPPGIEARVMIKKPSGKEFYAAAEATDENSVIFDIDPQMVAEIGNGIIQIVLTNGEKHLLTFDQPFSVKRGATTVESETGSPVIEKYIQEMREATDAANKAMEDIEETAANGGFSATIEVGKTETGEPDTNAQVRNVGTKKDVVFEFVIPRGRDGIMVPTEGMFALYGDEEGDLYAEYIDGTNSPKFETDENGNIYLVIGEE